ncbi:MAG TPA: peptidogalycan biosysnthesis protein [Steroidobacteraceae bacterium]
MSAAASDVERVSVAQGLEELPEAEWQRLVRGRPTLRLEVLKAIASHATRPLSLQVFLLEDGLGLAAAAICEAVAAQAPYNPFDRVLFGRAAPAVRRLGISTQSLLVFQTPIARHSPVAVRTATAELQRRLFGRLLDHIEDHAAARGLGIAFVGITPEDQPAWSVLRARDYLESEFDSTAMLDIQWSDFDSYVRHQRRRSKSAAQDARTERSRNRRAAVSIRQLRCTDDDMRALDLITREHYRRKNGRDPIHGPLFLRQLRDTLGEDLLIFEAVRNGARAAMLAVVRSGEVGWMAWIGVEQRDRPNDFTYANILFYEAADWAPALGLKTLMYGTAAQRSKVKRGCRLLALHLFYRPHRPLWRALAQPYLAIHGMWYRRKVY